jgi:hypothetical protein
MFAALPPHTAERLRLSERSGFGYILRLSLRMKVKKYICTGKPEAYRSVRRRSRISLVPNGWAGFTRASLLRT